MMESSPTPAPAPCVILVIASFHRANELGRLLAGLRDSDGPLTAIIVVDNGSDVSVREAVESLGQRGIYLAPGRNLGCGGGLKFGIDHALEKFGDRLTHIWILDDDAVVEPDTLLHLLDRSLAGDFDIVSPMIVDATGQIGWFPGLQQPRPWRVVREVRTPAEYIDRCGPASVPFTWSPGVCLLVTARALRLAGLPRDDFWVRGEDLEFSLRLTARFPSAFLPDVIVRHLQAVGPGSNNLEVERLKVLAMIQNLAFMGVRLAHGRQMLRTIPGNSFRFLVSHGWTFRNVGGLAYALWTGAARGYPAGDPCGNALQRAAEK